MSITVGVDSSSVSAAVAVLKDGKLLKSGFIHNGLTHSQTLLPLISDTLKSAGIGFDEVGLYSVTKGPGSFTGLRIGMSTVKGMAAVRGTKCVGVSSLEAAAYGEYISDKHEKNTVICAVMDARCNQVYNALFRIDENGGFIRLCDDRALAIDELKSELLNIGGGEGCKIVLTGDGAKLCEKEFADALDIAVGQDDEFYVHGEAVARLGEKYIENALPPEELFPEYLRLPQAQRELKLKKEKTVEK